MKADTLTLKQVFHRDIRYVVPMFQRPYVWNRTKHWEPLWDDIRTTTERLLRELDSDQNTDPALAEQRTIPHFLGAIVIDQVMGGVVELEARHVIDGQQRLTTLQLLLDAVQESIATHGAPRDAKLLAKLVLNDEGLIVDVRGVRRRPPQVGSGRWTSGGMAAVRGDRGGEAATARLDRGASGVCRPRCANGRAHPTRRPSAAPGPADRFGRRHWDQHAWTHHVARDGQQCVDPLTP